MASIMELKRIIRDTSREILALRDISLETIGGESMRENVLKLCRRKQFQNHEELQVAKEAKDISRIREISPMLS